MTSYYETHGADTEVDTLQILRAEHVQALVDNAALLARLHGASSERMPGRLDVVLILIQLPLFKSKNFCSPTCNPIVDRLVVLLGILDVFMDFLGVVRLARNVPGT